MSSNIFSKLEKSINNNIKVYEIMTQFSKNAIKKSNSYNLKFGEALIFWAPLLHCVTTNLEKETRWSLNFRYKNTISPYGTKKFID